MTKLILDLDTGIDDTLALAYALASPEAELIGVTGTFGNVTVEQGVANDLALLELFGRPEVPVFAGIDGERDPRAAARAGDARRVADGASAAGAFGLDHEVAG